MGARHSNSTEIHAESEIHSEKPHYGDTPSEWYLKLATECLRQSERMTSGNVLIPLQFNHGQCAYLVKKLEAAVQSARDCMSLASPGHILSKENWKLLVWLAMDVKSFIQECCKKNYWIQAASMLMNAFEHVASLSTHLELCIWSNRICRRIVLETDLRRALTSLSKAQDRRLRDLVSLLKNVEAALNRESISNSRDVCELVTRVLQEWEAAMANEPDYKPDLAELSVRDQVNLMKKVEAALSSGSISNLDERQLATNLAERFKATVDNPISEKRYVDFMRVDCKSLHRERKLGKGSFGDVYKVKWLGTPAAEKTLPEENEMTLPGQTLLEENGENLRNFDEEVSVLGRLSHPNILRLLCYVKEGVKCSIVLELMDKDLRKLIEERLELDGTRPFPFSTDEVVDIMLQIAEGMDYLHRMKVLHRDLKSQNILVKCEKREGIDEEFVNAKVADFGISKIKERSITLSHPTWNTGTTRWMAPELIRFRPQGSAATQSGDWYPEWNPYKSDVYSFGMVCYEILTGHEPFIDDTAYDMKQKVLRDERPPLPPRYPSCLRGMIQKCWMPEPLERPSFAEICTELRFMKGSLLIGREI